MKITFRALRVNRNLTQKELAEKAGITIHAARLADSFPERLSALLIVKLCNFYEVSFDDIFLPHASA